MLGSLALVLAPVAVLFGAGALFSRVRPARAARSPFAVRACCAATLPWWMYTAQGWSLSSTLSMPAEALCAPVWSARADT
jgi:hypothetical protein